MFLYFISSLCLFHIIYIIYIYFLTHLFIIFLYSSYNTISKCIWENEVAGFNESINVIKRAHTESHLAVVRLDGEQMKQETPPPVTSHF